MALPPFPGRLTGFRAEEGMSPMQNPANQITPNSIERLPDRDLLFLIQAYADKRTDHENIRGLIGGDVDIIEMMVESDRVFQKVMDQSTVVQNISPFFFFTLLLRRSARDLRTKSEFLEDTLEELNQKETAFPWNPGRVEKLFGDRELANYLANMISIFTRSSRMFQVSDNDEATYHYIVDLIQDSQHSDPARQFRIYCHIGNYTLFLTGLFPEFIEHQHKIRRRPMDERFYIDFGRTYYGLASDHQMARNAELDAVFSKLSLGFVACKRLLNYMTQHYLRPAHVN